MSINESNAKLFVSDYVNFGNAQHFKYKQNLITAFAFERERLSELISGNNAQLFVMLALSQDDQDPPQKHMSLVIGSMLNDSINMEKLIISDPPYTTPVYFSEESSEFIHQRITYQEFIAMRNAFQTASDIHLTSTQGHKVKAYVVPKDDLTELGLREAVTPTNRNDLFVFVPVVRPAGQGNYNPFDRPFVSFAIARLDQSGNVDSAIMEYCLPCPSACATNYWFR